MNRLPLPLPLVGSIFDAQDLLPSLSEQQPGLMNALVLLGHPFKVTLGHPFKVAAPAPKEKKCICGSAAWTIPRLKQELIVGGLRRRHISKRAKRIPTCYAQWHDVRNGTVHYDADSPQVPCRTLLDALDAERSSIASAVYGVVDLESVVSRFGGGRPRAKSSSRCLAPLRGLGNAVIGRLHSLTERASNGLATAAHVQLRIGTAPPNRSRYQLHYDRVENFLLQIGGSKRLFLAPPSQAVHASLDGSARGGSTELGGGGGGGMPPPPRPRKLTRHSPIDFSLPSSQLLARWPRASRLRGLRVELCEGETLFIPSGWLHMVESNDASSSTRRHGAARDACAPAGGSRASGGLWSPTRRRALVPRSGEISQQDAAASPVWLSANLFFTHGMRPTIKLFDACERTRVLAERAKMPAAHAAAFDRLGAEHAREAYCTTK